MAAPADRPISPLPAPLPALLTVEEAALLLRIGRTKAYAMTRQWRDTGGCAGLPVVDFENVLRVPLAALEQRLGVPLAGFPAVGRAADSEQAPATPTTTDPLPPTSTPPGSARRKRRGQQSTQLGLFGPAA